MTLLTRQLFEQTEQQRLASYATLSSQSRGRVHPEPPHPYRSCFQRDRDRVIHASAFRRLEAKTQVFFDPTEDYPRTRLTHTIEVTQIARTLARILNVNEDLAETAALAHDLGHPPYGHCGEAVLNQLMTDHGGFDHNAQSLRVVTWLEHPYPQFRGLNLTYEVRDCLAKHESRYDRPDLIEDYGSGKATLEGQIADLADAIAYNSHDLDDALFYRLIAEDDVLHVPVYRQLKEQFEQDYPEAHQFARQLRCAKRLIDYFVSDVLRETTHRLEKHHPLDPAAVSRCPVKLVALSDQGQLHLDELADFLYQRVYEHPDVARAQQRSRQELEYLFQRFCADPQQLPARYAARIDDQGRHRVICDYLAGMTDRFCHNLYQRHTKK